MDKHENWFVAQLKPNGLAKALEHLKRQKITTFSPTLMTTMAKSPRPKESREPLFPGYIFLQFDRSHAKSIAINSTRGVSRLISLDPRHPSTIAPQYIAELKERCDETGLLLPPVDLQVGERVRILTGPFAQTLTTIENLPAQDRVGVLFDIMGQIVRTTLPRDQVRREAASRTDSA